MGKKYTFPTSDGQRINTSRSRFEAWESFSNFLRTGETLDTFHANFNKCTPVNGHYKSEAFAIWMFLRHNPISSIVEVGRNLGGNLFLMACACAKLQKVLSIDLLNWEMSDDALKIWFEKNKIDANIAVEDSTTFVPYGEWDFVYIDGGHTGEIVEKDILAWKDRTKYIGFHDYADKGRSNSHKRVFKDVVNVITQYSKDNNWEQVGFRGNSEVIFKIK